ncbi:MAG TPA: T9SS type A sorting domain-containing protein [Ignavibacteria bacterium]|nr:T9SS type A sorting domain-containing protein [Ignavibacteria bacterium]HRF67080.1 T9SS type A sorting domain-containing protein [Ignavibacteria bacterium]HRJ05012.1 T9SS type A sorting domain-containing protein [Ignavibacteria bacterium]HRJ85545.1 T9SS type A sorting domain-containing protein [Ignavibacteria bacterium]
MKKSTQVFAFLLLAWSFNTFATTWNVNVQNFSFSPANLPNVFVGDTIKWTWINGDHHTTTSATIPQGAATWDAPLHSGNQVFSYVVTVAGSYHYVCTPHFPGMEGDFTANIIGISQIGSEVPVKYSLLQNYPNPFNPVTNIEFSVPKASFVKLTVMNFLGQQVGSLVNEQLAAGNYRYDWNAYDLPSGTYFYRLETAEFSETKKMILIK